MTVGLKTFEECIEKVSYGNKIQRSDYLIKGNFPVVSQESSLINGYWNKETDVVWVNKPVIVFGDHTRVLKYIDFNFVLGADGTKIIKPKEFIDSKFFYYFLQANPIETKGYARHYRFLKDLSLYVPPLATQQKIVAKLDAIFAEIDKATAAVEANAKNAEALFQSYLNEVFESGGEGWSVRDLPSLCTLFNGRAYSKNELLNSGKYTVLRVGNFFTNEHWYYSNLELDDNKYCENGDLLYAWSASFGPRIWSGDKVIYHYHIWKVVPNKDVIDKMFLFYLLEWDVDKIKRDHGTGATMIHVSKKSMESRVLPYVDIKRQKDIVLRLDALKGLSDSLKRHYQKKAKEIQSYKNSILQQAFNGELIKE